MKKTFATWVTGLGAAAMVLAIPYADAFWSRFGNVNTNFLVHQDLTKNVLVRPFEDVRFSDKAKAAIIEQHINLDTESITPYSALDHVDSQRFLGSYAVLVSRHRQVMDAVRAGDQEAAWSALGKMLHTVQDFYSHSTWVWKGQVDIIDFGKALSQQPNTNPPPQIQSPSAGGCESDHVTVSGDSGFTTGYYPPSIPAAPPNKCAHGGVGDWAEYYVNPIREARIGIALDFPGLGDGGLDDVYRNNAEKAQVIATRESYALVKSIVQSVKDDEELGMCGVCLLTDTDDPEVCNCEPLTVTSISCSIQQRLSNQDPPVAYNVRNWVIQGTARSSVPGAYPVGSPNPSLGIATPAVVTSCSKWTGYYNYFGLSYCSRNANDPNATTWSTSVDSPLDSQQVRANLFYSAASGPPVATIIKSGLACPGSYTYE